MMGIDLLMLLVLVTITALLMRIEFKEARSKAFKRETPVWCTLGEYAIKGVIKGRLNGDFSEFYRVLLDGQEIISIFHQDHLREDVQ